LFVWRQRSDAPAACCRLPHTLEAGRHCQG